MACEGSRGRPILAVTPSNEAQSTSLTTSPRLIGDTRSEKIAVALKDDEDGLCCLLRALDRDRDRVIDAGIVPLDT
jgi:hypothetical protein